VRQFLGNSELILTRFRTESQRHNEQTIFITRIAQRNYRVRTVG
jgi:hypothetical protein